MNAPVEKPPKTYPRLLWVEGKDDRAVVHSLCAANELPERFRVDSKSGVGEILETLFAGLRVPETERLGVIVDANGSAQARWDAIRRTLLSEEYVDVPERLEPQGMIVSATHHRPMFGAWIMPDNGSPGALEDFAAALVPAHDWLWSRAGEAVDAIPPERRRFSDIRRSKAHIHTWLAWQEYPGSPMGQAVGKGDLDAHAPAAARFVAWLRRLMVDDPPVAVEASA